MSTRTLLLVLVASTAVGTTLFACASSDGGGTSPAGGNSAPDAAGAPDADAASSLDAGGSADAATAADASGSADAAGGSGMKCNETSDTCSCDTQMAGASTCTKSYPCCFSYTFKSAPTERGCLCSTKFPAGASCAQIASQYPAGKGTVVATCPN